MQHDEPQPSPLAHPVRGEEPCGDCRPRLPAPLLLMLLVGVMLQAAGGRAQEEAPPSTFFESLDVQLVGVEVVVTDRQGAPVLDLTVDDFEVLEDGQPVEISHFSAPSAARRAPAIPLSADAQPPPATEPEPGADLRHVVVYVDQTNLAPGSPQRLLAAVSRLVRERLEPTDRVMVVTYDAAVKIRGHILGGPEADVAIFSQIEGELANTPQGAWSERMILGDIQRAIPDPDVEGGSPGLTDEDLALELYGQIDVYRQGRYGEIVRAAAALEQFVDSLSGLPGHKTVIYLNDGLPRRVGEDLLRVHQERFGSVMRVNVNMEAAELDTYPLIRSIADQANANRVTFYAFSGSGGGPPGYISAESPGDLGGRSYVDSLGSVQESRGESLQLLAASTGGVAAFNSRAFDTLMGRVADDLDATYSLAYAPRTRPDGERRRLEVRVRRPDLRVRHRDGYLAQTTDARMSDRTVSALVLGEAENPLDIAVEIGEEKREKRGVYHVSIAVKVPLGKLVLLPEGPFHEGRISIFVAARDPAGRLSPVQKAPVPIRIPNDQLLTALSQVASYSLTLAMAEGEQAVAVGVRDELGHVESAVLTRHTAGRAEPGR